MVTKVDLIFSTYQAFMITTVYLVKNIKNVCYVNYEIIMKGFKQGFYSRSSQSSGEETVFIEVDKNLGN